MNAKIIDGKLIIEIPLNVPPRISASGKSLVIASTNGNMTSNVIVDGKNVVIGLNAYIKK